MFENQNAATSSPEPRGRSPAGSATSDANRPTSKVRASFVSVEPHAAGAAKDLGTTKGVSANTPAAHRRESFSVSADSTDVADLKQAISEAKEERKQSIAVDEAVPEQAVETRVSGPRPSKHFAVGRGLSCSSARNLPEHRRRCASLQERCRT